MRNAERLEKRGVILLREGARRSRGDPNVLLTKAKPEKEK